MIVPALIGLSQRPLIIVHGSDHEIDAAVDRAGIVRREVEGIRIVDEATLDIVVTTLAGGVNTRLVAALCHLGIAAVGLTGVDAHLAPVLPAPRHRTADGESIELGRVGVPFVDASSSLIGDLLMLGYIPVIASVGASNDGQLFQIDHEALATHIAAWLGSSCLILADRNLGVLDDKGRTIPSIDRSCLEALLADEHMEARSASKLLASRDALEMGIPQIVVADIRNSGWLSHFTLGWFGSDWTVISAKPSPPGVESLQRKV